MATTPSSRESRIAWASDGEPPGGNEFRPLPEAPFSSGFPEKDLMETGWDFIGLPFSNNRECRYRTRKNTVTAECTEGVIFLSHNRQDTRRTDLFALSAKGTEGIVKGDFSFCNDFHDITPVRSFLRSFPEPPTYSEPEEARQSILRP